MKKILFLLLVCFFAKAQQVQNANAKITEVKVFLNQAQIFATANFNLSAGEHTLIIKNVAQTILPNTLQVGGIGDLVILSTSYENNYIDEQHQSPKLKQYSDSLRMAKEYLRVLQLNADTYEREKDLLKANYPTGTASIGASPEKVKAMADFFRARMSDINQQMIRNEAQIFLTNNKIERYTNQIKDGMQQPSSERVVLVQIKANTKTQANIELNYIAQAAGWSAIYDIRAKSAKQAIDLNYKANVWQNTGIDWPNVKLSLSNTNTNQSGDLPYLNPQFIDIYVPQPAPVYRSKSAVPEVVMMDAATVLEGKSAGVEIASNYATVVDNGLAVSFDINGLSNVNTNEKPKLVDIRQQSIAARFVYKVLPKLDTDAFLLAEITKWQELNLLNGPVKMYFEGAYVGESYVNNQNLSDTLTLGLGRDKRILVKREVKKDFTSKKTLSNQIRENKAYTITVKNNKKEAVTIEVIDQIPVAQNSEIEISERVYASATFDNDSGKLTWILDLKPGEERKLEFSFMVKYPKNKQIIGL